jgi:hypothetical protein
LTGGGHAVRHKDPLATPARGPAKLHTLARRPRCVCSSGRPHPLLTYGDGRKAEGVDYPVEEDARPTGKGKSVHKKQTVADRAEEVFALQATTRHGRTGESFGRALLAVLDTVAPGVTPSGKDSALPAAGREGPG